MNFINLFNDIKNEGFSEEIAVLVTASHAIHLSITPTESEFENVEKYSERVSNTINEVMWQHTLELDEIHKIRKVLYEFEIHQVLSDTPKTIKELMNEK